MMMMTNNPASQLFASDKTKSPESLDSNGPKSPESYKYRASPQRNFAGECTHDRYMMQDDLVPENKFKGKETVILRKTV